jgi:integrase
MPGTRALNINEEAAVMAALDRFPLRDQAVATVMLQLGFRITETLSLTLGDVWAGGRIRARVTVDRARLKGGKSCRRRSVTARSVVINARAEAVLERFFFSRFGSSGPSPEEMDSPLFRSKKGCRLSRWQANRVLHQVLAAAGIEASGGPRKGEYGTHSLRKTFACRVYQASGHDLVLTRCALGHTTVSTTEKYLPITAEAVDRAIFSLGQDNSGRPNEGVGAREKPARIGVV